MGETIDPATDGEKYFNLITPTHRMANAQTFWCIERAHLDGVPFLWIPHPGDALIGRARSYRATWALLESPSPYTVWLDSDIIFEPGDLRRIFEHLKAGYDLIGGVYTVRSGAQLAHYGLEKDGGVKLDGTVQEVEWLSTGFTGFTKRLLQKMVDELHLPLCYPDDPRLRMYPFFENYAYEYKGQFIYLSEDWDFCLKARKVGVKPYLDTSVQVGHEGWKVWTLHDLPAARLTPVQPSKLVLPKQFMNRQARREAKFSRLAVPQ